MFGVRVIFERVFSLSAIYAAFLASGILFWGDAKGQTGQTDGFYGKALHDIGRVRLLWELTENNLRIGKIDTAAFCKVDSICEQKLRQIYSGIVHYRKQHAIHDTTFNIHVKLLQSLLMLDTFTRDSNNTDIVINRVVYVPRIYAFAINNRKISEHGLLGTEVIVDSLVRRIAKSFVSIRTKGKMQLEVEVFLEVSSGFFKKSDVGLNERMCKFYYRQYQKHFPKAVLKKLQYRLPGIVFQFTFIKSCRVQRKNISKLFYEISGIE